jgi:uncharacterized protein
LMRHVALFANVIFVACSQRDISRNAPIALPSEFFVGREIDENAGREMNDAGEVRYACGKRIVEQYKTMQKPCQHRIAADQIELLLKANSVGRGGNCVLYPRCDVIAKLRDMRIIDRRRLDHIHSWAPLSVSAWPQSVAETRIKSCRQPPKHAQVVTHMPATQKLEFALHNAEYALVNLPRSSPLPACPTGKFFATIQAGQSVTVVCDASAAPPSADCKLGFRCLEVIGSFDLASVGVVAAVTQPLAVAGVSLFAYSTWQTDYIFIQAEDVVRAREALCAAGHTVHQAID